MVSVVILVREGIWDLSSPPLDFEIFLFIHDKIQSTGSPVNNKQTMNIYNRYDLLWGDKMKVVGLIELYCINFV